MQLDEDGKPINPHIPQFMASAPWYLNEDKPTLKHQKNWKGEEKKETTWYDRGAKVFQATKYRKGACTKYVGIYVWVCRACD
jgi:pre-mRNA-processing factor SLU7